MPNRSTFPTTIDTFVEHFDITPSDVLNVKRYQELKIKSTLTSNEQSELQNLTVVLRDKIFTPEDFNKLQDCITNLETFFNTEVDVYVDDMQTQVNTTVANGQASINQTKDDALVAIENKKQNVIDYLDGTTAGQLRNDIGIMGEINPTFTDNTSLVHVCNELDNEMGNIADLNTTNKSSVVNAINEVNTGSNILTKIKTVDGSGSGLDADTVRGVDMVQRANDLECMLWMGI
jgi:hypothetical protein